MHELYVWQLSQEQSIGSAHIVMSPMTSQEVLSKSSSDVDETAQPEEPKETHNGRLARLGRCLHGFGIQRVTLQIEDSAEKAK